MHFITMNSFPQNLFSKFSLRPCNNFFSETPSFQGFGYNPWMKSSKTAYMLNMTCFPNFTFPYKFFLVCFHGKGMNSCHW